MKRFKYFACRCLDCMHICRLRQQKTDTSSDLAYVKDKGTLVIGITLLLLWIIMKRVIPQTLRALRLILQELFAKTRCYAHFPGNKLGGKRERAQFKNVDCLWNGLTITDARKTPCLSQRPIWQINRFS